MIGPCQVARFGPVPPFWQPSLCSKGRQGACRGLQSRARRKSGTLSSTGPLLLLLYLHRRVICYSRFKAHLEHAIACHTC